MTKKKKSQAWKKFCSCSMWEIKWIIIEKHFGWEKVQGKRKISAIFICVNSTSRKKKWKNTSKEWKVHPVILIYIPCDECDLARSLRVPESVLSPLSLCRHRVGSPHKWATSCLRTKISWARNPLGEMSMRFHEEASACCFALWQNGRTAPPINDTAYWCFFLYCCILH